MRRDPFGRPRRGFLLCVFGALLATLVAGCGGGGQPASASPASSSSQPTGPRERSLCTGQPLTVDAAPGEQQTRGCLVSFVQNVADPAYEARFGASTVRRRYVLYVPASLPATPAPVVFVFPGYGASAETAAVHYTHTRFESLADQHGFVVVYGNGLPYPPDGDAGEAPQPEGGYFQGCFLDHSGEGIDVRYVREILGQLEGVLKVDRTRVYAAGLSAGGGLTFQLALEAPGLVAAIAPVAPLPFQPGGEWLMHCNPVRWLRRRVDRHARRDRRSLRLLRPRSQPALPRRPLPGDGADAGRMARGARHLGPAQRGGRCPIASRGTATSPTRA